ncbi:MAG: hypothetical protein OJJ54_08280 [Pseudonocardia sp.]|nr:hypothetical protein [Pseudonocardia sp.]
MKTLTADSTPIAIANEAVELRKAEAGEMTVSFIRLAEGTDLGPALVGLEGDRCPCPHWGYMLEGRLLMRAAGGESVYEAGEAFYWAPGHAPVALTDCAYVDFSPTKDFEEVIAHISAG